MCSKFSKLVQIVETIMYSTSGAPLRCTAFAIKYTAYPIMFIRSFASVYCFSQQIHWIYHQVYHISYHVNQEPHFVYCISQQVYCICHHVHQEPRLGVLHLPSRVLHILSCKSGASLGVLYLPHRCTAYAIVYIRSPTWVYCICNQVCCVSYHVHQEPHLGLLHLPVGALDLPSSVLQRPSCTSGTSLGCTAFAIKCTVETNMCSKRGASHGCTAFAIKCIAYPIK